jgi:RNA polymerase sigma factor (sigma-70 family)
VLVVAAAAGEEPARTRLVEAHMPTIAGMARIYRNSTGVGRDELMQEGVVGLLRAVGRYDPGMDTPFWPYASWWVRQAMQQLVAEMTRPVVLSDRALRKLARVKEARRAHLQAHGREPKTDELAAATDLTRAQVESLVAVEQTPRALEEPLRQDGGVVTLGELMADPVAGDAYDHVLEQMEIEAMRELSRGLADRERGILEAHYGLGRPSQTLREIAGDLGLSVERVRQVEARALQKLREAAALRDSGEVSGWAERGASVSY